MMEWWIAIGLFGGLVAVLETGFHGGRRVLRRRAEPPDQLATIQGAMLGLLALMLGFSFAFAATRFSDRAQLIATEANAIGTAWLRCDLLPENEKQKVRQLLRRYVEQRVAIYDSQNLDEAMIAVRESEDLQNQMWAVVSETAKASPALATPVLGPFNEMIDAHGCRVAAGRRHLPFMLMTLLLACSAVSVGTVGYSCGISGKRNVILTTALAFLIAATLWAIVDLDHPNKGLIRTGQQPMLDLQKSFREPSRP